MSVSLDRLFCVACEMPSKKLLSQICVDAPVVFKKEPPACSGLLK